MDLNWSFTWFSCFSSRNNLLSNQEKIIATELYKALKDIAINKTNLNSNLINLKKDHLKSLGINVDYLISCDPDTFEECYKINEKDILVAIAAYVGKIRLIDNIKLTKL